MAGPEPVMAFSRSRAVAQHVTTAVESLPFSVKKLRGTGRIP